MEKRIFCSYTKREWIQIDNEVKKLGKKSVLNYLVSEIKNLDDSFLNHHPFEEDKLSVQKRTYYPPDNSIEILNKLSGKLKIPPSTIVSRLLLTPLLKK